jgi:hypothetical protein
MSIGKKADFLLVCAFALCGMVATALVSFVDHAILSPSAGKADGLIARVASDLVGLDERWQRSRTGITAHRNTVPQLASGGESVPSSPN